MKMFPIISLLVVNFLYASEVPKLPVALPVEIQSPVVPNKKITWKDDQRKKVILFSSTGGGGHSSAAQAITTYLENDYQVEIVDMVPELLSAFDFTSVVSQGSLSGEGLYNYLLKNQYIKTAEAFINAGKLALPFLESKFSQKIESFLKTNKPDIVISVVPVFNVAIYKATQKLKIPFAVITLDLDFTNYWNASYVPLSSNFFFGIPIEDQLITEKLKKSTMPQSRVRVLGFPVRKEFLERRSHKSSKEEIEKFFQDYAIPANKKILMVLMGAVGTHATITYAHVLSGITYPIHILFLIGKNEALRKELETITFSKNVSISIVGFTNQVADFMSIADAIITKPGSTSVFEALCIQTPLILDATSPYVWWEKMNIDFVKKHTLGAVIADMGMVLEVVDHCINSPYGRMLRRNSHNFHFPDALLNIKNLINEMLGSSLQSQKTAKIQEKE